MKSELELQQAIDKIKSAKHHRWGDEDYEGTTAHVCRTMIALFDAAMEPLTDRERLVLVQLKPVIQQLFASLEGMNSMVTQGVRNDLTCDKLDRKDLIQCLEKFKAWVKTEMEYAVAGRAPSGTVENNLQMQMEGVRTETRDHVEKMRAQFFAASPYTKGAIEQLVMDTEKKLGELKKVFISTYFSTGVCYVRD